MKAVLFFLVLVLDFSLLQSKAQSQNKPNDFEFYVLALSWQPAFCETKADKHYAECECETDKSFDAKNFTLHGLWPSSSADVEHNYGYCGVDEEKISLDKKHKWSDLPANIISKPIKQELEVYMPGSKSDLYKHEWFKHGVCTGLSADNYFKLMLDLEKQFTTTKFNQFIASKVGQIITRQEVYKQFEQEFGKGTGTALSISCTKVKGVELLTEIQISLVKDISGSKKLKNMLLKGKYTKDKGPESFKIDKVGIGSLN